MRYLWSQAAELLKTYNGTTPLNHVLKAHFKSHPALGSRDRKLLSALLYAWFRVGKTLSFEKDKAERPENILWQAALLLTQQASVVTRMLPEAWRDALHASFAEKRKLLLKEGILCDLELMLPEILELSEGINRQEYLESMLHQPHLFLRVRHNISEIEEKLKAAEIAFTACGPHCLDLPNGTSVEKVLSPDSYVVQDRNSQQTGIYFQPRADEKWWDCCAGAGGKSLLLLDQEQKVKLTVSDLRPAILSNLQKRFAQYDLPKPRLKTLDAAHYKATEAAHGKELFDGIICDAPCSGSGTWARTPEQLYFFQPQNLQQYATRQVQILKNASAFLKPEGKIIYITCSVFKAENEGVTAEVLQDPSLELKESKLLNGTAQAADTLFVAVFLKKK